MTLAEIVRLGKNEAEAMIKSKLITRKSTSAGSVVPNRHGKLTSIIDPVHMNGKLRTTNATKSISNVRNVRHVFRDEQSKSRQMTQKPAFITTSEAGQVLDDVVYEPAILEGSMAPSSQLPEQWIKLFLAR